MRERKAPCTRGLVPIDVSVLGGRLARTEGQFCLRSTELILGGSKCRGLGAGGGAPARADRRALLMAAPVLPSVPVRARDMEELMGLTRGETSALIVPPDPRCNEDLDKEDCSPLRPPGELERVGERTRGAVVVGRGASCKPERFRWLLRALARRLLCSSPPCPRRGDGRKPEPELEPAPGAARSAAGDCERRLPAEEVDCTEEERRTPEEGRQERGAARLPLVTPPVEPSLPTLSSSSSLSCCCNSSMVACIWLLMSENW